ncbi:hypothetical protein [Aestuariibacter salexigens]|uniref:hypothetical protein n=1 Tax=Aestuariibacter salexigens TaxID=226010 RepID=UPI00040B69D0|nr:hypothetical protein [Aestuariibacter salexigens]
MNHNEIDKLGLERQAAELFGQCFAEEFQVQFAFISHNVPRKPDVTCYVDNQLVDIEIAHLYGSQAEAQRILGKSLSKETREELCALERDGDTDLRLIKALNRILSNKSAKRYDSKNVWLVIRNANPNWDKASILGLCDRIHVPASHPFTQIWLLGDFFGASGLIRLYPKKQP